MKKIITFISLVMVFLPWTIFPLRTNPWALQSPAAEIIVYSYAAFMIFSAINDIYGFTALCLLGLAVNTALGG